MPNYAEAIVINMHIPSFIITKKNEALKVYKRHVPYSFIGVTLTHYIEAIEK